MAKASMGEFLIIDIEHMVGEDQYYTNRFRAIPSCVHSLPLPHVELSVAEPQMANVIRNDDPDGLGRVQVKMNWQTGNMHTDWIRVLTPDGGTSKVVEANRGFVFIPEVGDQVLVGFRYGDPSRPFVMGSLYNGRTGKGGFAENHKKSLTTRSGSTITFDDTAHTILLQTAHANKIFVDEKNGTIAISSAEEVNVNTKNVNINATENMNVNVGKNFTMKVGEEANIDIDGNAALKVQGDLNTEVGKNVSATIVGNEEHAVKGEIEISAKHGVDIFSYSGITAESEGITTIAAKDNMYIKSKIKIDIAKG